MPTLRWILFFCIFVIPFPETASANLSDTDSGANVQRWMELSVRQRDSEGAARVRVEKIRPEEIGIILVDMWNSHPEPVVRAKMESLIPRLNETLKAVRERGGTIFYVISNLTPNLIMKSYDNIEPILSALNDPSAPNMPPFPGNGFFWPETMEAPMMHESSQTPPNIEVPALKSGGAMHKDIEIAAGPTDLVVNAFLPGGGSYEAKSWTSSAALTEIYKTAKKRGITHLFCTGIATNQCMMHTAFGMINLKRLGFKTFIIRDLTRAGASNGIDPKTGRPDPSHYPNRGSQIVDGWIEQNFDGSVASADFIRWLDTPFARYSSLISSEPSLLAYWDMAGKPGYRAIQDRTVTQDAWGENIEFSREGLIAADGAVHFDGTNAVLVSPFFRADTPVGSPLENLSAGSFTVEAWGKIDGGQGKNRWIVTHDDGTTDGTDFLLGVNAENCFEWTTNGTQNKVVHPYTVTQNEIRSGKIFHLVAVQDLASGELVLYVNSDPSAATIRRAGTEIKTRSSLQIGSRGATNIDDGEDGEGKSGRILSKGFEFFEGTLDEVAIYGSALDADLVRKHYSTGLSSVSEP
jgi:nicotinamidase-related amidase